MSYLSVEEISKRFTTFSKNKKREIRVLEKISFKIEKGKFVSICGPNGCGKTTLLNIIAGLISPDSGRVLIKGQPPQKATIGYVFQNYAESLFPWLKNIDNIALPLKVIGKSLKERKEKVKELVTKLHFDFPLNEYPYCLSGGQQQMVALARGLINDPDVLLLDEPFAALDYHTRLIMQDKIQEIHKILGITILFVSHDLEEALYLADQVIFFSKKPTKVVEILENPLPRPRTFEITKSEEFFLLKNKTFEIFKKIMSYEKTDC